ncbi:YesL family protein [Myceligenerans indicum]|uniref:YesL family protein n=1 Tax=Myceligenerans indicum TaxID=2593663 RepID=A0ABS1LFD7_9MICO|nr:YesL family protein [Myceligenerans indicum]MBL0884965.1 YesL family protein [Myceligenerans indicum]
MSRTLDPDPDSALLRFLTKVADLMILNLVFVATSVPVLTLGASLTALNFTAMRLVTGECESVTGDYLRSFRANFRQATLLGLAVAFLGVVLAAWYVAVDILDISAVARFLLQAICYLVAFRVVLATLYAFPYLARFENSVPEVLNNSRLMSLRHLFASLTVLTVTALPVVITVFYPAMTAYGLLWFLIGFAATAFVNAYAFTSIFDKYIPPSTTVSVESAGMT